MNRSTESPWVYLNIILQRTSREQGSSEVPELFDSVTAFGGDTSKDWKEEYVNEGLGVFLLTRHIFGSLVIDNLAQISQKILSKSRYYYYYFMGE